jgi:hypothetical protein
VISFQSGAQQEGRYTALMLAWNQQKMRQLTPAEIWFFIVGRVLVAFGAGLLLASYMPSLVAAGWPSVACGSALLLLASKGLTRRQQPGPPPHG